MPKADIKQQIQYAEASSGGAVGSANITGIKSGIKSVVSEPILNYFADLSKSYSEISKKYAQQATSGMLWVEINLENWVSENGRNKYEIDNLLAVAGIFKGNWENKEKIICDYTITDDKTIIYSHNVFEGYVLGTSSIIAGKDDLLNTLNDVLEILSLMQEEEIVDLTNQ